MSEALKIPKCPQNRDSSELHVCPLCLDERLDGFYEDCKRRLAEAEKKLAERGEPKTVVNPRSAWCRR